MVFTGLFEFTGFSQVFYQACLNHEDSTRCHPAPDPQLMYSCLPLPGENFMQCFDRLMPEITKLLHPNRTWRERRWGICYIDDAIEFAGLHVAKYRYDHQRFFLGGQPTYA